MIQGACVHVCACVDPKADPARSTMLHAIILALCCVKLLTSCTLTALHVTVEPSLQPVPDQQFISRSLSVLCCGWSPLLWSVFLWLSSDLHCTHCSLERILETASQLP